MEIDVTAATNAIKGFLQAMQRLDDDVIEECDDLLLSLWHIENSQIRIQIIQTAALHVGLLREEDLD